MLNEIDSEPVFAGIDASAMESLLTRLFLPERYPGIMKRCAGRAMNVLWVLLVLVSTTVPSWSQTASKSALTDRVDSPQPRTFRQESIDRYLQNEDYAYDRERPPSPELPNFWDRIWNWIVDNFFSRVFSQQTENYWDWVFYAFCVGISVWAILKLTGTNVRGLFSGRPQSSHLRFEENESNIHFIDFERMIAEAIDKGEYRRAVRLFYLSILKQLSDRELIDWRPDKTNHDYLREWRQPEIEPGFRRLTVLFEYICYGDFSVDQGRFEAARREFRDFENQIKQAS